VIRKFNTLAKLLRSPFHRTFPRRPSLPFFFARVGSLSLVCHIAHPSAADCQDVLLFLRPVYRSLDKHERWTFSPRLAPLRVLLLFPVAEPVTFYRLFLFFSFVAAWPDVGRSLTRESEGSVPIDDVDILPRALSPVPIPFFYCNGHIGFPAVLWLVLSTIVRSFRVEFLFD